MGRDDRSAGIGQWDPYNPDPTYGGAVGDFADEWAQKRREAEEAQKNWNPGTTSNWTDGDMAGEYTGDIVPPSPMDQYYDDYDAALADFNKRNPSIGTFGEFANERNRVLGLEDPDQVNYGMWRNRAADIRGQQMEALGRQALLAQGVGSPLDAQSVAAQDILARKLSQSAGTPQAALRALQGGAELGASKAIRTADAAAQERLGAQTGLGAGYTDLRGMDYRQAQLEQAKLQGDLEYQMMKERLAQDYIKMAELDKATRAGFEANINLINSQVPETDWADMLIGGLGNMASAGIGLAADAFGPQPMDVGKLAYGDESTQDAWASYATPDWAKGF